MSRYVHAKYTRYKDWSTAEYVGEHVRCTSVIHGVGTEPYNIPARVSAYGPSKKDNEKSARTLL